MYKKYYSMLLPWHVIYYKKVCIKKKHTQNYINHKLTYVLQFGSKYMITKLAVLGKFC